ncbi:Arm DNA-binding domain-containing protein [Streptomyces sp. NBC_00056]|uniref:Arm DNA-binding domain-containing protein n=1 Tax=unclassified Streptomyces TaxID=2593676 RepID=UPI0038631675
MDTPRTTDGRRHTVRRSGFATRSEAEIALAQMRENLCVPEPFAPAQPPNLDVRRRDHLGGSLHAYEHAD